MIALDDNQVPGHNQKVHSSFDLAGEDLSGAGSFAVESEEGVKPKVLKVTTVIDARNPRDLASIIEWAEAEQSHGERKVYVITNELAQAMKIRKAKFSGLVSVKEHAQLKAWNVSFKLIEVLSVAERRQLQQDEINDKNTTSIAAQGHSDIIANFETVGG